MRVFPINLEGPMLKAFTAERQQHMTWTSGCKFWGRRQYKTAEVLLDVGEHTLRERLHPERIGWIAERAQPLLQRSMLQ